MPVPHVMILDVVGLLPSSSHEDFRGEENEISWDFFLRQVVSRSELISCCGCRSLVALADLKSTRVWLRKIVLSTCCGCDLLVTVHGGDCIQERVKLFPGYGEIDVLHVCEEMSCFLVVFVIILLTKRKSDCGHEHGKPWAGHRRPNRFLLARTTSFRAIRACLRDIAFPLESNLECFPIYESGGSSPVRNQRLASCKDLHESFHERNFEVGFLYTTRELLHMMILNIRFL